MLMYRYFILSVLSSMEMQPSQESQLHPQQDPALLFLLCLVRSSAATKTAAMITSSKRSRRFIPLSSSYYRKQME